MGNDNTMICKADKSNNYAILKIDNILQDHTKFCKSSSDPTSKLKSEVNKLILESNTTSSSSDKLDKIIREF